MSGHIGLREDARIGHHLAKQITELFVGCAVRTSGNLRLTRCARRNADQRTLRSLLWRV